jgi:FKBP-type peptidyl-prolyl cis-trans isomerase FklB
MPKRSSGTALTAIVGLLASTAIVAGAPLAEVPASGTPNEGAARQVPSGAALEAASYDVGLLLGTQLATNGLGSSISRTALKRGIDEALGGHAASTAQTETAQQYIHASRTAFATRNTDAAHKFLEKNLHASGIKTLPSGLQYRVLEAGNASAPLPGPRDQVTLHYRASLSNGTELDRSDEHSQPAVFRLNSVIEGWREALSAMRPGAKWQVFVPPELAYGAHSPPPIPPGSLIVYELELVRSEAPPEAAPRRPTLPRKEGPAGNR